MSSLAVRPDPSRVFGIAIAVSVHIAAGMLLLIGVSPMWNLPQAIDEPLQTVWIRPKPTPVVPVMPVAPPKLEVVKPTPTLAPTPRISVVETVHPQTIALPVVADPVEMAAPTVVDVPAEVPVAATPSALAYAFAPPPAYPIPALRRGEAGTVWLRVEVDAQGRPTEVTVQESSGSKALDQAARKQVLQRWRFVPARQGDRAVAAVGLVPIVFSPAG